jgi:hypothetical protein
MKEPLYPIGSTIYWHEYPTLHWRVIAFDGVARYVMNPLTSDHERLKHYKVHKIEGGLYNMSLADSWTILERQGASFDELWAKL